MCSAELRALKGAKVLPQEQDLKMFIVVSSLVQPDEVKGHPDGVRKQKATLTTDAASFMPSGEPGGDIEPQGDQTEGDASSQTQFLHAKDSSLPVRGVGNRPHSRDPQ